MNFKSYVPLAAAAVAIVCTAAPADAQGSPTQITLGDHEFEVTTVTGSLIDPAFVSLLTDQPWFDGEFGSPFNSFGEQAAQQVGDDFGFPNVFEDSLSIIGVSGPLFLTAFNPNPTTVDGIVDIIFYSQRDNGNSLEVGIEGPSGEFDLFKEVEFTYAVATKLDDNGNGDPTSVPEPALVTGLLGVGLAALGKRKLAPSTDA